MHSPDSRQNPVIYNLFPRLVGDLTRWPLHAERAAAMGFNWLYVNPIFFCGFSGSCYAVKDPDRIDPLLLPATHADAHHDPGLRGDGGAALLQNVLRDVRAAGLLPMIDLVLNHTSRDAALVREHPEWYVRNARGDIQSPSAIDPADARRVTVWGDLAELNFATSPDRASLIEYWTERVVRYLDWGFEGFRCDAAYKVPVDVWRHLIGAARARKPQAMFLAETLGARLHQIEALHEAGFDAVLNSLKYWHFDKPWLLEQQAKSADHVRSVSFPESHDTQRLWTESGGRLAVQKQRYAIAAAFSSGVLLPMGYEYGFERPLHVVETRPEYWESSNIDLSGFVRSTNAIVQQTPAFHTEWVEAWSALDQPTLLLARHHPDGPSFLAINKDWHAEQRLVLPEAARGRSVHRVCLHDQIGAESTGEWLQLSPSEVAYIL
jgi:starch synthase (maltosyl-transferring)